jgi:RHS repeat-associated protein
VEAGEVRYRAFGATRFTSGTTPTSYRFTGQREEAALGLYFYNARWYDPALGHFLSPDTVVPDPGNALDYHRYAYVRFNPLKYEDGSGHCATLANGQADENDVECWRLARTIANLWNDTDYWRTRFGELDVWNNHIAPSAVTVEFMRDELDRYMRSSAYLKWSEQHPALPIPLASLNDPVCGGNQLCQAFGQTAEQLEAFCQAHDCIGIGNDAIGVGAGLLVVGSPLCGPAAPGCIAVGTYAGGASTVFGIGWTVYNYVNNNASNADLAVTLSLAASSLTTENPRVALTASILQLTWDAFLSSDERW